MFSLNSSQAFHGSYEDFLTWSRETERKIQRDDSLKLEESDLDTGLAHLKVHRCEPYLYIVFLCVQDILLA